MHRLRQIPHRRRAHRDVLDQSQVSSDAPSAPLCSGSTSPPTCPPLAIKSADDGHLPNPAMSCASHLSP